ncbi:MAG TPA: zf-HC2 domain-containing protein [Polyangiaceae bacterium]
MDCEKFESLLIDELYGELDEVTSAAVRRHAAGCARCGALLSGLRATRKVAALPMEEPPGDLEDRILSAVREQQKVLPFRARASSALSRAGAWAMRPQTAMAAVFLVVIGTSFVLVQSRKQVSTAAANAEGMPMQAAAAATAPGAAASAYAFDQKESAFAHGVEEKRADVPKAMPSTIVADNTATTTDGDRERDKAKDELAKNDTIANAAPIGGLDMTSTTRGATVTGGQGQAMQQQAAGGGGSAAYGNVQAQPLAVAEARTQAHANANGSSSALAQAKALKQQSGCAQAVGQFDQLRGRADVGGEATLEAARCYRALGNSDAARQRYSSLASTQYATTAQQELDAMAPAAARKTAAPAHMETQAAAPPRATATTAPQSKPANAADAQQKAGY